VIIRTYGVKGLAHKLAVPLTLIGTIIVTLATWSVVGWKERTRRSTPARPFCCRGRSWWRSGVLLT